MNKLIGYTNDGFIVFVPKDKPYVLMGNVQERITLHTALQNFIDMAKRKLLTATDYEVQVAQQLLDCTGTMEVGGEINIDLQGKALSALSASKPANIADLTECDASDKYETNNGGHDESSDY